MLDLDGGGGEDVQPGEGGLGQAAVAFSTFHLHDGGVVVARALPGHKPSLNVRRESGSVLLLSLPPLTEWSSN